MKGSLVEWLVTYVVEMNPPRDPSPEVSLSVYIEKIKGGF